MTADRAVLARNLTGHRYDSMSQDSGQQCTCGSDSRFEQRNRNGQIDPSWDTMDEHLADVVLATLAAAPSAPDLLGHDHSGADWQCEACKPLADVLRARMRWPSLHWGRLHDDAYPSLARAVHKAGYVLPATADVAPVPAEVACESCEQPIYGSPAPDCLAPEVHITETPC